MRYTHVYWRDAHVLVLCISVTSSWIESQPQPSKVNTRITTVSLFWSTVLTVSAPSGKKVLPSTIYGLLQLSVLAPLLPTDLGSCHYFEALKWVFNQRFGRVGSLVQIILWFPARTFKVYKSVALMSGLKPSQSQCSSTMACTSLVNSPPTRHTMCIYIYIYVCVCVRMFLCV